MIDAVHFRNFKALRETSIQLSRFTLIVGPNGSGKSTALQALRAVGNPTEIDFEKTMSTGLAKRDTVVEVLIKSSFGSYSDVIVNTKWSSSGIDGPTLPSIARPLHRILAGVRIYSFEAQAIAAPAQLQPNIKLGLNGSNLAGVLDGLRDHEPERFEQLNAEMARWLPEFDRILFDTPAAGMRTFLVRTQEGHYAIPAAELSHGTLLALAILTLAYAPDPPPIVGLEEPDRGIHPRLLREVRDAMYRLSYPENYSEKRDPVQVIATTHSPYLLDLYKDHPEEIVIAQKVGQEVKFERLSDRDDLDEILRDAQLGDVWYSGVLGGVPSHP